MKISHGAWASIFGSLALALSFAPNATAQCSGLPKPAATHSSWHYLLGQPQFRQAGLLSANDWDDRDGGIVGFWHVKFVSDGISSGVPGGVPKGATVDAGYSQWHSDGTEIMNSGGRAPNTGNFCLGVWARVGQRQYRLNHRTTAWDPTKGPLDAAGNPAGELVGPGIISELVTLAPDGSSFSGAFAIDQYDLTAKVLLVHLEGTITGTRINVNTPIEPIF